MAHRLCVGDAVLVDLNNDDNKNHENDSKQDLQIGVIKYIGYIEGYSMSEYIGIELVESIDNGHNGIINGCQYFKCRQGHGIYSRTTNVIRKLAASEIASKMQEILSVFKTRLNQYVSALSERDEYIEGLKTKQRHLRRLLNESKALQHDLKINKNNLNTLSTDCLQKSSPSPVGIILFNPQKQSNNNLSVSIASKSNSKQNVSNTPQFGGFVLSSMTPMTLTPNSDDTRTPIPHSSDTTIIHHGVIRKRLNGKNKINVLSGMEILDSYYEDNKKYAQQNNIVITPNHSLSNSSFLPSMPSPNTYSNKSNKYKSPWPAPTEESLSRASYDDNRNNMDKCDETEEDELCDEYDGNSSLEETSCLFSTYSTRKSMSNAPSITPLNTDSTPLYKSISHDISCNPPQQQYAYSHIKQEHIEKQRENMNRLMPMRPNHINYPMQKQLFKSVVFVPSPQIVTNKNIQRRFVELRTYNTSKTCTAKPQYLPKHNNQSVFIGNDIIGQQQNVWIHPQQQQQQNYQRQYNHANHAYYAQYPIQHCLKPQQPQQPQNKYYAQYR